MTEPPERIDTGTAGRPTPTCPECGIGMQFRGGEQIHDLWAEKFVCPGCARESYRSYGRGSV